MSANKTLSEVKSWMSFFGWENGGNPGSVKRDETGKAIASHGDNQWVKDVEDCCERVERDAIRAELERRSAGPETA